MIRWLGRVFNEYPEVDWMLHFLLYGVCYGGVFLVLVYHTLSARGFF